MVTLFFWQSHTSTSETFHRQTKHNINANIEIDKTFTMEIGTPTHDPIQAVKVLNTRRPLQRLNVNVSQSPSPAKKSLATKPKQLSLKSMMETQEKLSVVSENVIEWPSLDKEQPTPSLQSETEESQQQAPIFRQQIDLDDIEDMLVLKRANPVYDSDDEDEDMLRSPSKRQRTNEPSQLFWNEQLSEDDSEGFTLCPSFLHTH